MSKASKKRQSDQRHSRVSATSRSNPKSLKANLAARTAVGKPGIVTPGEIVKKGAAAVLADLSTKFADWEKRSRQYRRNVIASVYQVSLEAKSNPHEWASICESPKLAGAPRPPDPKKPGQALRYSFMVFFGTDDAGRKKASKEARALKDHFERNRPVTDVLRFLQTPASKKVVGSREPKRPVDKASINLSRLACGYGGRWAAGSQGRIEFNVPEEISAEVIVVVLPLSADRKRAAMKKYKVRYLADYIAKKIAKDGNL